MLIIHSKFCWNFSVDSLRSCVLCWSELDGWPWWSLIRFSCDHLGGILQKTSWKDFDTKHFICPLLRLWLLVSIFFVVLLCPSSRRLLSTIQSRYPIDYIVIFFIFSLSWLLHIIEQHWKLNRNPSIGAASWAWNTVKSCFSVSAKYHISHWQTASESLLCADGLERNDADAATLETRKRLEKSLYFGEVDDSWTRPTDSWVFWCDQRSTSLRIAIFFFPMPETAKERKNKKKTD